MLEEKVSFEVECNDILESDKLLDIFWKQFSKKYGWHDSERYVKVGPVNKPVGILMKVTSLYNTKGEIYELDDVRCVSEALIAIRRNKIIGSDVYREFHYNEPFCKEDGEYLIAVKEEPTCKIIRHPIIGNFIFRPMTFKSYDGENHFSYDFDMETRYIPPKKIDLEVRVKNQKKQALFVKMFKQVCKHYEAILASKQPKE